VVPLDRPAGGHAPRSGTDTTSDLPAAVARPVLDAGLVEYNPVAEPVPVDPPTDGADRSVSVARLTAGQLVTSTTPLVCSGTRRDERSCPLRVRKTLQ
jgi:hypothetical protein